MKKILIKKCSDCPYNDEVIVPAYLRAVHERDRASFCYYTPFSDKRGFTRYKDEVIKMFEIPKWCPL